MPTTKAKNFLYCLMLPFVAPGCGSHPVSAINGHSLTYIRSFERLVRRHHVLGSSTLIESDGQRTVICTSSGSPAHVAHPDTYYRVASITKTATSVLVMKLVDLGILNLDKPVSALFDSESAKASLEGITLRFLLSHTSGLTDPPDLESSLVKGIPFPDIVSSARKSKPGSTFHYSNLGFGLIGCILESVLHRPVGEIFREYLFHPLNMNATLEGCLIPKERIMPVTRILPYRKGNELILTPLGSVPLLSADPLCHYGHTAGSLYADISSLHRLFRILISNEQGFLSSSSINEIKKVHAEYGKLSPTLSYCLGLLRIDDPAISRSMIYGHQGFAYGCADGAFWEETSGRMMIFLNGGCSEARTGRLGIANRDLLRWAFRKELPSW